MEDTKNQIHLLVDCIEDNSALSFILAAVVAVLNQAET